ncbi:MAG: hypothetical protein ABSD39_06245 [Terriglobales bacterium]|jgi:hypothetical protein
MTEQNASPELDLSIATGTALADAIHSADQDVILRAAADPALTGDLALALLQRNDLSGAVLEQLAKHRSALGLRKARIALACHPHTPRHVSVPLIRQFYTFDLMKVALSPLVPADVKLTADETLVARLKTTTSGERLTLARRGSGRIAGALLLDGEQRIMRVALENSRLAETSVMQAVVNPSASIALVEAVSGHGKWSPRRDVQVALLRSEHLSLARALAFAGGLPPEQLREILQASRLPTGVKENLLRASEKTTSP